MARRALVVEDDPDIVELVEHYLARDGWDVDSSGRGRDALRKARSGSYQLLVLDLQLPDLDGLSICAEVRRDPKTVHLPIVMLTARGDETDRIVGLEGGADDYIVKPFSPRELVARVRAVLRRGDSVASDDGVFRRADLKFEVSKMKVDRGGASLDFTPTEFQLLTTLARRPGRIFTRSQLLDAIRGPLTSDVESFDRAIDAHVKNIRRKLEPDPRTPRYVLSVYGIGYKFSDT